METTELESIERLTDYAKELLRVCDIFDLTTKISGPLELSIKLRERAEDILNLIGNIEQKTPRTES